MRHVAHVLSEIVASITVLSSHSNAYYNFSPLQVGLELAVPSHAGPLTLAPGITVYTSIHEDV